MKKKILTGFYVTIFVFITLAGVSKLTQLNLFNAFDAISQALAEFELTDYVFSKFRPEPQLEDRIVLVNIGPNRRAIAEQIRIVSQYNPRVIGIDSFFNCEGNLYDTLNCPQLLDTLGNLILSYAIQEAGNVVLVSRLLQSDSLFRIEAVDAWDSIEYSDPMFSDHARNAYANLVSDAANQEDIKICRTFIPRVKVNGEIQNSFAVEVCKMYDSTLTQEFLERGNFEEVVNYRGNASPPSQKASRVNLQEANTSDLRLLCFAIDWQKLFEGEYVPDMFEDKIVLFGYMGEFIGDPNWAEDKWFTPLNTKVAGRANPDMFGLVVHANIIAMILNADYVDQLAEWQKFTIAFVVCFFNVLLFNWIDRRFPVWFDGFSAILQIAEIVIVMSLVVMVFAYFQIKMDLTLTIGILALVGPCFDIMKSVENTFRRVLPLEH